MKIGYGWSSRIVVLNKTELKTIDYAKSTNLLRFVINKFCAVIPSNERWMRFGICTEKSIKLGLI